MHKYSLEQTMVQIVVIRPEQNTCKKPPVANE